MGIPTTSQEDEGVVATLVGRLKDQAQLSGVREYVYLRVKNKSNVINAEVAVLEDQLTCWSIATRLRM